MAQETYRDSAGKQHRMTGTNAAHETYRGVCLTAGAIIRTGLRVHEARS